MNNSNWTYIIEVNDSYVNLSGLTIKRSDGSIVSDECFWRENQTVYLLDNVSSEYQMIYCSTSHENVNLTEPTTSNKNGLFWGFGLIFMFIMIGSLCLFELRHKRRQVLSFYVKQGNDKINEIDQFIEKFKSNKS